MSLSKGGTNEYYTLACLRDRVFFPGLKNSLEVARPQSINAINMASFDKDGYIVVSAQSDYR